MYNIFCFWLQKGQEDREVFKSIEAVSKLSILFEVKEGENYNRRNTRSISRIALKLHCVPKFEPDIEIGQKGMF